MNLTSELLQYILSGLTMGGIYALVALGFVMIHNVTGIINFAQGEFLMLGAMFMVTLLGIGLPAPFHLNCHGHCRNYGDRGHTFS